MDNFNQADIDQYHNSEYPSPTQTLNTPLEEMSLLMHVLERAAEHVTGCLSGLLMHHKK